MKEEVVAIWKLWTLRPMLLTNSKNFIKIDIYNTYVSVNKMNRHSALISTLPQVSANTPPLFPWVLKAEVLIHTYMCAFSKLLWYFRSIIFSCLQLHFLLSNWLPCLSLQVHSITKNKSFSWALQMRSYATSLYIPASEKNSPSSSAFRNTYYNSQDPTCEMSHPPPYRAAALRNHLRSRSPMALLQFHLPDTSEAFPISSPCSPFQSIYFSIHSLSPPNLLTPRFCPQWFSFYSLSLCHPTHSGGFHYHHELVTPY